jgi:hypothetical protein
MTVRVPVTSEQSKKNSATARRARAKPLGVTINTYASAREVGRHVAANHQRNANFPKPIQVVGLARKIRYYNERELDKYFKDIEFFQNKLGAVETAKLLKTFVTTIRPPNKRARICTLAEDD